MHACASNAGDGLQRTSMNCVILTDELDQRVSDTAVRQRRRRLVKAKDGHFEHKLSQ